MQHPFSISDSQRHPDRIRLLKYLVKRGEDHAREVLVKQQQDLLTPICHAVDGFDHHYAIVVPMDSDKEAVAAALKAYLARINAKVYSFICAAWESVTHTTPSEDPHRREIVCVVATDGVNSRVSRMEVSRRKDGKVKQLKKTPISVDDQNTISGRFADLLVEGYA
jgi:predicted exporter